MKKKIVLRKGINTVVLSSLLTFSAVPMNVLATEGDGSTTTKTNTSTEVNAEEDGSTKAETSNESNTEADWSDGDSDPSGDDGSNSDSTKSNTSTETNTDVKASTDDDDTEVKASTETNAKAEANTDDDDDDDNEGDDDSNTDVEGNAVNKLELSSSKSDVKVGHSAKVMVKGWDNNGNIIDSFDNVDYSVNNSSVATINSNGELVPKAAGTVTVTVTADGVSENFTFNVMADGQVDGDNEDDDDNDDENENENTLVLNSPQSSLNVGESLQLNLSGLEDDDDDVSFELSNNSKASITEDGKLTAKNAGKVTVWAKTDDGKAKFDLMIHNDNKSDFNLDDLETVELDLPKTTLNLKETLPLDVDGFDSEDNKIESMTNATFSVDDESIATIDAKGHLHPKSEGTVTVTANVNGTTDSMDVVIEDKELGSINLDTPKSSIGVNEKLTLYVNGLDEEGTDVDNLKDVEFKVSDESVAEIDSEGNLIPKANGTVTVWAMADGQEDSVKINITGKAKVDNDDDDDEENESVVDLDDLEDVSLDTPKTDVNVNEKVKLWVKGLDDDGEDLGDVTDVTFDVSDESVAEITTDGYLVPKSEGTVTVTANIDGKTDSADFTIDDAGLEDISFETPEAEVDTEETFKLKVNGVDENGNDLDEVSNVDFEVDDESIATVDDEGNVTPLTSGTVTVTATADEYTDEMTLTFADNGNNNSNDTETTTSTDNDSDAAPREGWTNDDFAQNDSSNMNNSDSWTASSNGNMSNSGTWTASGNGSMTTPGVPQTGDGSTQTQTTTNWAWTALGLLALAASSIFNFRKQDQE